MVTKSLILFIIGHVVNTREEVQNERCQKFVDLSAEWNEVKNLDTKIMTSVVYNFIELNSTFSTFVSQR